MTDSQNEAEVLYEQVAAVLTAGGVRVPDGALQYLMPLLKGEQDFLQNQEMLMAMLKEADHG